MWVKQAMLGVWALEKTGAANDGMVEPYWEDTFWDPNGRVHKSVTRSFLPRRIITPFYPTAHLLRLNVTSHPTLVKTRMPKREAILRSGMMWPVRVTGRPSILMLHLCVNMTVCPSANETWSGFNVGCLLWTGVPSITKICVLSESAMMSHVESVTIAVRAWCCARLEMFEATTVLLSESMADGIQERVGYKELIL
jgi:hypothetical protein